MIVLVVAAMVAGAMAVLRYGAGLIVLVRFARGARLRAQRKGPTPPISLIKPVYGKDPGLEQNFRATLRQNYPEFEVLVVHERSDDPALPAVEAAARDVADVPLRILAGRESGMANPKVAVIVLGEKEARFDIVATADSDVRPDPLYLRDLANGLKNADAVSFVPVVYGTRSLWARAAALVVNGDGVASILLGDGQVMTGSTIGVRREALEHIGGYRSVADRIADDYSLGQELQKAGFRLALAARPARLFIPGEGLRHSARWVMRWARTIRTSAPGVYAIGVALSLAPLLLLLTLLLTPGTRYAAFGPFALGLLVAHTALRALAVSLVDVHFARDQTMLRSLPLLPLLWILEPLALVAGCFGGTVNWRGRRYRLRGGRATLVDK